VTGLGLAQARVVFLRSIPMILSFFSSRGWESWDVGDRPLLPERMPVLVDDDLRFEDGPGAPRPLAAVNRGPVDIYRIWKSLDRPSKVMV
jgi:hypothetical protein